MTGHTTRRAMTVLCAAILAASLTTTALAADPEVAARPRVKCHGIVATKIGTAGPDRIRGTTRRDVIAGLGGNDVILGLGGNDIICGGAGNDRLVGGPGRDNLFGQTGRDRLFGGTGLDKLYGGLHNDILWGQAGPDILFGGAGSDRLDGGVGIDTCYQNSGHGKVHCELPRVLAPPLPSIPTLIPLTGIHAIAYSDIDGLNGYSTGDVLIAKLVDANPDGVPGWGDKVVTDRYPTNLDATAFATWGVTERVVDIAEVFPDQIRAHPADGDWFEWRHQTGAFSHEMYYESQQDEAAGYSSFFDTRYQFESDTDFIWTEKTSPSEPAGADLILNVVRQVDDVFLDVELGYQQP